MAGRRTSERQRVERTKRIRAAADRGDATIVIAEREHLSDRQVRRILAADEREPALQAAPVGAPTVETAPLTIDPFAIRADVIRTHVESLETLRVLARTARQEAVRVGAARSAVSAAVSLLALLQRVGMAPPAPAGWLSQEQWELVWRELGRALEAAGVQDVVAFADDLARRVGTELAIGDDVALTGTGPSFERRERVAS